MNIVKSFGVWTVWLVCGALLLPAGAPAQEARPADQATPPTTVDDEAPPALPQPADAPEASSQPSDVPQWTTFLGESQASRPVDAGTPAGVASPTTNWSALLPDLRGPTLTWIAVVVILVLILQTKPLLSWHNLDGLVLVLTVLLLPLRNNLTIVARDPLGQTIQWWTYMLLCLVGLYWLERGVRLLFAKTPPTLRPNISVRAMTVLIVAGLLVAGGRIATAPLSHGSRDGLIGGIYTAETGKLPYGDAIGHDARSPLLYLLHAGAVQLVKPTDAAGIELRWADRAAWLDQATLETANPKAVRLVNAVLLLLLLGALAGIGHRTHSVAAGQTLVAILCIFPGALECLPRPEIMLPTVLLAWSFAFAFLPRVGGLLSVLTIVLAGLAWPWAWLMLPALLAYFFRHQWQAFGATVGLLGGLAAIVVGTTTLVAPALPRADGALREAGITPSYAARLSDDGTPVIDHHQPDGAIRQTFKTRLWQPLLARDELRLDSAATQLALPNGVDAGTIRYRDVTATGPAREVLQTEYRAALAREPELTQTWVALRTLLEATWKPEVTLGTPTVGVWELWGLNQPHHNWTLIRRVTKILVGLLALGVAFALIRGRPGQLHQLTGGLLAISAATLLVSLTGAATNWIWLMPAVLAALVARGDSAAPAPETHHSERPPLDLGPAPRITVEQ